MTQRIIRAVKLLLIPLSMATAGAGCASTRLHVRSDLLKSEGSMATITFTRLSSMVGAANPLYLSDATPGLPYDTDSRSGVMTAKEKQHRQMWQNDDVFDRYGYFLPFDALLIGEIGPGGSLTWQRPSGVMDLVVCAPFTSQPDLCYKVEGGKNYVIEYNFVMGRVENAYCLDSRSQSRKPLVPYPVPAKLPAVQTIDRLPSGTPKGYVEFYVPKDSKLHMIPIGQITATNWIMQSTVYPEKKLRIACPPGNASFMAFNMDKFRVERKEEFPEPSWAMSLDMLKIFVHLDRELPLSTVIKKDMVTPIRVSAAFLSSDKASIKYLITMISEPSRPDEK